MLLSLVSFFLLTGITGAAPQGRYPAPLDGGGAKWGADQGHKRGALPLPQTDAVPTDPPSDPVSSVRSAFSSQYGEAITHPLARRQSEHTPDISTGCLMLNLDRPNWSHAVFKRFVRQ